jgi:hypothetical protein
MARSRRRFRAPIRSPRHFAWQEGKLIGETLDSGTADAVGELTTTSEQNTALVDREATLVRGRGEAYAFLSTRGTASDDLLVAICVGVMPSDVTTPTTAQIPSLTEVDSSAKWWIYCCMLLSSQGFEGVRCNIDTKAKRKMDVRQQRLIYRLELNVVEGTLGTATFTAGLQCRCGWLLP